MLMLVGVSIVPVELPFSGLGLPLCQAAIILKLGGIPCHMWYISVLQDLKWEDIFSLSTVQKLLPLFFFSSVAPKSAMLVFLLMSRLAGILASVSSSIKRLIGYSRILNLSWIMAASWSWPGLLLFFTLYTTTMGAVSFQISQSSAKSQFDTKSRLSGPNSFIVLALLLRLGGFPPLTMFWAKIVILGELIAGGFSILVASFTLSVATAWMVYLYTGLVDMFILTRSTFGVGPCLSVNRYFLVYSMFSVLVLLLV